MRNDDAWPAGGVAEHHQDVRQAGRLGGVEHVLQQRAVPDRQELLDALAHPDPPAGREDDGDDAHRASLARR